MLLEMLKTSYCFFVIELIMNCDNGKQLDKLLDKMIDDDNNCKQFDCLEGDCDVKAVSQYVYQYRCYNRSIIETKPEITLKTIFKVFKKSLF